MHDLPILKMSLERVARDFHLHVVQNHTEIQRWIEENLDNTVQAFIANEMSKLIHGIVTDACRSAISAKMRERDIQEQIEKAVEDGVKRAVTEAIRDHAVDEILWSDDKQMAVKRIMDGTKALANY